MSIRAVRECLSVRINSLRQATGCWQWRRRLRSLKMPRYCEKPASAAESAQALPSDTGNQQTLNDALKELAQPGIVLNAPQGVSISSPQAVRLSSGSASVGIVSQQNTDISALKRFTVAAEKPSACWRERRG
nr:Uncharacterized protein conserved in bacteria [Klebsiella pneumoniae]